MSNDELYNRLMSIRKSNPKAYFFNTVRLKYDQIVSAYNRKNENLLRERVYLLNDYLKEYAPYYGITAPELKQFFVTNNMNFKF